MLQMFAAKLFEQRVMTAYREQVANERQKKFLEELEEESRLKEEREAKKQLDKEKKRDKKRLQKQAKEEERLRKETEKQQAEALARAKEAEKAEQARLKRMEQKQKKVEERRQHEEERRKRVEEDRLQQVERERKRKEREELEHQAIVEKQRAEAAKAEQERLDQERRERDQAEQARKEEELAKQTEMRIKQMHQKQLLQSLTQEPSGAPGPDKQLPPAVPLLQKRAPSTVGVKPEPMLPPLQSPLSQSFVRSPPTMQANPMPFARVQQPLPQQPLQPLQPLQQQPQPSTAWHHTSFSPIPVVLPLASTPSSSVLSNGVAITNQRMHVAPSFLGPPPPSTIAPAQPASASSTITTAPISAITATAPQASDLHSPNPFLSNSVGDLTWGPASVPSVPSVRPIQRPTSVADPRSTFNSSKPAATDSVDDMTRLMGSSALCADDDDDEYGATAAGNEVIAEDDAYMMPIGGVPGAEGPVPRNRTGSLFSSVGPASRLFGDPFGAPSSAGRSDSTGGSGISGVSTGTGPGWGSLLGQGMPVRRSGSMWSATSSPMLDLKLGWSDSGAFAASASGAAVTPGGSTTGAPYFTPSSQQPQPQAPIQQSLQQPLQQQPQQQPKSQLQVSRDIICQAAMLACQQQGPACGADMFVPAQVLYRAAVGLLGCSSGTNGTGLSGGDVSLQEFLQACANSIDAVSRRPLFQLRENYGMVTHIKCLSASNNQHNQHSSSSYGLHNYTPNNNYGHANHGQNGSMAAGGLEGFET